MSDARCPFIGGEVCGTLRDADDALAACRWEAGVQIRSLEAALAASVPKSDISDAADDMELAIEKTHSREVGETLEAYAMLLRGLEAQDYIPVRVVKVDDLPEYTDGCTCLVCRAIAEDIFTVYLPKEME